MKRLSMLAVLLVLAGCQRPAEDAGGAAVQVSGAICRPTPNGRQATGCYLTLTASRNDTLTAVESPVGALAQIHSSNLENNMMIMYEMEAGLPLPAGQAVSLAPGGNHIMLLGVKEPLVAGDTVPLTLTFAGAPAMEIEVPVGQPTLPGTTEDHAGH
jgi:copper(I)-binding protein